jgi:D-tyrosyl-tRNA(Tyr) deacylase
VKALLQRVSEARVVIATETVGQMGRGLLVLVCAERGDHEVQADKLLARILKLRIFPDDAGKMNCSLQPAACRIWTASVPWVARGDTGRRLFFVRLLPVPHA